MAHIDHSTEFVLYSAYIDSFQKSWRILDELKIYKASGEFEKIPNIINAAFQFALVEYCKPYTASYWKDRHVNRHNLDVKFVPEEFRELHDKILRDRNEVYAHKDFAPLKPGLLNVFEDASGKKDAVYAENIIYGTEELLSIDFIIRMIVETIDNIEDELEEIKQKLDVDVRA